MEQLVQYDHFPRIFYEMFIRGVRRTRFLITPAGLNILTGHRVKKTYCTVKQIRMTCYFPKLVFGWTSLPDTIYKTYLHDHVHQTSFPFLFTSQSYRRNIQIEESQMERPYH